MRMEHIEPYMPRYQPYGRVIETFVGAYRP
jgi:hypothetical protein